MVSLEVSRVSYRGVRQDLGGPLRSSVGGGQTLDTDSELQGWRGSMNMIDFRESSPQLLLFISDLCIFQES